MIETEKPPSPLWDAVQRVAALLLLAPASLIVLPFLILIQVRSPGPLLIRSTREGRLGVTFPMLKVRTMVPDAEDRLAIFLAEDPAAAGHWRKYGYLLGDPRIVGRPARLARYLSIDELPQLLNVVRGQMNLVGPRPIPSEIAEQMTGRDRCIRRSVKPGITGLWQVVGRSEISIRGMGRLDRLYVVKWTVLLDLMILSRTLGAVIGGRGAY